MPGCSAERALSCWGGEALPCRHGFVNMPDVTADHENTDASLTLSSETRQAIESFRRQHETHMLAILFTDIVGSTLLKSQLGDSVAKKLSDEHKRLLTHVLREVERAQAVKMEGDSFLFVFLKPSDALRFALRAQYVHECARAKEPRLPEFRIGIHLGTVFIEEGLYGPDRKEGIGDIAGLQVDTSARIMGLAEGGQILCSRIVFDDARQALKGVDVEGVGTLAWESHGMYVLKGREEPIEVCEVRADNMPSKGRPIGDEKARPVEEGDDVPGWRPAVDTVLPSTNWVIAEKLGEGGYGEVWLAHDRKVVNRKTVFKFCTKKSRAKSLKRELSVFNQLSEKAGRTPPGIVEVLGAHDESPPYYIQLEYVPGGNLRDWIREHGESASMSLKLDLAHQMCRCIQRLHEAGLVHRDIKPSNFLVQPPEDAADVPIIQLTDFGIGQVAVDEALGLADGEGHIAGGGMIYSMHTRSLHAAAGTYFFIAPELVLAAESPGQIAKKTQTSADIYSLGVTIYQLFAADTNAVPGPMLSGISDLVIRDDIAACLAREPASRPTIQEFAERISRYEQRIAQLKTKDRRRFAARAAAAAGVLVFLCFAVTVAWFMGRAKAKSGVAPAPAEARIVAGHESTDAEAKSGTAGTQPATGIGKNGILILSGPTNVYARRVAKSGALWSYAFAEEAKSSALGTMPNGSGGHYVFCQVRTRLSYSILCLDAANGRKLWHKPQIQSDWLVHLNRNGLNARAQHPMLADAVSYPNGLPGGDTGPHLLVSPSDGTAVMAIKASDGGVVWTREGGAETYIFVPDVNGDGIYDVVAHMDERQVICLSGVDGKDIWAQPCTKPALGIAVPDVDGDNIYDYCHGRYFNGTLDLRSGASGKTIWTRRIACFDGTACVVYPRGSGGFDIISAHQGGVPHRLSSADGAVVWAAKGGPGRDSAHRRARLLGTPDSFNVVVHWRSSRKIGVVDGETGASLWTRTIGRGHRFYVALPDQNGDRYEELLVSDDPGLWVCDGRTGAVLTSLPGEGVCGAAYIPAKRDDGLVLHWTFDELDPIDASGRKHHGTIVGSPECVPGVVGNAFRFDGRDHAPLRDRVSYSEGDILGGLGQFTVACWFNASVIKTESCVLGKQCDVFCQFLMGPNSRVGGKIFFGVSTGGRSNPNVSLLSNRPVKTGEWYHMAATYDGSTVSLFVNGVMQLATARASGPVSTHSVYRGIQAGDESRNQGWPNSPNGYTAFDGLIDDVRVYNRALSRSQIKVLYELGQERSEASDASYR